MSIFLERLLFLVQHSLKSHKLLLHVSINLQISSYDLLHLMDVVIYILVFLLLPLNVRDQLALLCN